MKKNAISMVTGAAVAAFSVMLLAPAAGAADPPSMENAAERDPDCVYQRDYANMYDCQHSNLYNDCRHDPGCRPHCAQDDTVVHFYTCYD